VRNTKELGNHAIKYRRWVIIMKKHINNTRKDKETNEMNKNYRDKEAGTIFNKKSV
jgi:hypothetical protein